METTILGYAWEEIQAWQQGKHSFGKPIVNDGKDYGADPLGDGMFRMVPSGDIVSFEEKEQRLMEKRP
jgi:hypothetical protein